MGQKFGEDFFRDQIDRGRRELGGLMFEGSNIAQPMYPLRGSYGPSKQMEGPEPVEKEASLEEVQPNGIARDDPDRDDRDLGLERE